MKKLFKYPLVLFFALFLLGFFLIDFFSPPKAFSEFENKELAQKPSFSFSSFFANRYFSQYESYVNDQFFLRDEWISLRSRSESVLGKLENNGILYGKDGYLFERFFTYDENRFENNLDLLKNFAAQMNKTPVTFAVIPNSYEIYPENLPAKAAMAPQQTAILSAYETMPENVRTVDLTPRLTSRKDSGLFYKTDHHWTTRGAYEAYQALYEHASLPEDLPEHTVSDFYGTYYSKAKNPSILPDTLSYYDFSVDSVTINGEAVDGLYDLQQFTKRDKYAGFLWGNKGLSVIKSEAYTQNQKKVLLIKDSFGNSFAPFLLGSFSQVYLVDLRSYNQDIYALIESENFDEILILYSFMNLSTDASIAKLKR